MTSGIDHDEGTGFDELQAEFVERFRRHSEWIFQDATIVVLPSITFPEEELRKITGIQHYEERMLFTLLLLTHPGMRVVFVSSVEIDPAIIDYYLSFLPSPSMARSRLELFSIADDSARSLCEKLLARDHLLPQLKSVVGNTANAYIYPFNVTDLERCIAERLGVPIYGPRPEHAVYGYKSGARKVAREAGVPVFPGEEDLRSLVDLERASFELMSENPGTTALVVKLNNGFSGQGNAIIMARDLTSPIVESPTTFCGVGESWTSFTRKLEEQGAVIEELVKTPGTTSPSVQLRITPAGDCELLSTHDQMLSGPDQQVYVGCSFPALGSYRSQIQAAGMAVARILASKGVFGSFGIDFVIVPAGQGKYDVSLSEINLRLGGTTHPYLMTRLVTGGSYDSATGELTTKLGRKCYVATDNLKSEAFIGLTPETLIEGLRDAGLGFDRRNGSGVMLHLLGALKRFGKLGMTCVADDEQGSRNLYDRAVIVLEALATARL